MERLPITPEKRTNSSILESFKVRKVETLGKMKAEMDRKIQQAEASTHVPKRKKKKKKRTRNKLVRVAKVAV